MDSPVEEPAPDPGAVSPLGSLPYQVFNASGTMTASYSSAAAAAAHCLCWASGAYYRGP